eukprot:gene16141-4894_t
MIDVAEDSLVGQHGRYDNGLQSDPIRAYQRVRVGGSSPEQRVESTSASHPDSPRYDRELSRERSAPVYNSAT